MTKHARITGIVEYREGDGAPIVIRRGPCEVQETEQDVTLSWSDGDTHGSAAMPRSEFERFVKSHAIEVLDS
jgi:hypothetical protein